MNIWVCQVRFHFFFFFFLVLPSLLRGARAGRLVMHQAALWVCSRKWKSCFSLDLNEYLPLHVLDLSSVWLVKALASLHVSFFFSLQAWSLSDDPASLSHLLALQPATATVAAACLCQAVLYAIVSRCCKHLTCICWLFFRFLPLFFPPQVQMFCTMEQ